MSHQRWHEWRNMDDTTCPAHGCVRLVAPTLPSIVPNGGVVNDVTTHSENEVFGPRLILHGKRPNYNFVGDTGYSDMQRGLSIHFAFNGDISVAPGELGLLTWDLPTWAVVEDSFFNSNPPPGESGRNGQQVSVRQDWTLIQSPASELLDNTGVLYVLAVHATVKRVFVGAGVVYSLVPLNEE